MMNDIQPQNFLSNFDDPAAALLTYFINENDSGAAIMPVPPPPGNSSLLQQLSPQDHAYSRISDQVLSGVHTASAQNASYSRSSLTNSLPQVPSSQAQMPTNQTYDMHLSQSSSSNYSGSLLCSNTNGGNEHGQMLFDNTTGMSHMPEQAPSMIKKFNYPAQQQHQQQQQQQQQQSNLSPQPTTSSSRNYNNYNHAESKPIKSDRVPNNTDGHRQLNASNSVVENQQNCVHPERPKVPRPMVEQPPPLPPPPHPEIREDVKVPIPIQAASTVNHVNQTAELRTVITLRIADQVVVNGVVVKETIKEEQFVRKGGHIPWTNNATDYNLTNGLNSSSSSVNDQAAAHEDTKASLVLPNIKRPIDSPVPPFNSNNSYRTPTPTESKFNVSEMNIPVEHKGSKGVKRQKGQTSVNKKVKPKTEVVADSEEARQEMASALLSLQAMSNVDEKPIKHEVKEMKFNERNCFVGDNLTELKFLPLAVDNFVMAKWTDKNFYPGRIVQKQSDSRWQVYFDDGGKRTIHETEIICVPYLCGGQIVMVSFNEGFCLRGVIKRAFYEKSKLFYEVEYNDNSNKRLVTEKFARKDTFLTHELGMQLLNRQMKNTPENASKFTDVDLNNIIPKRSRHTAQVKLSDDVSSADDENEAFVTPKSKPKKVKAQDEEEPVSTMSNNKSPPKNLLFDEAATTPTVENPRRAPAADMELLGPLPPLGSGIFQGIAFLLTSVDGCNVVNDNELNAGRSTAPFDISYLSEQIEIGGGRVYETVEEAQDSTDCIEIVLIAYTYLRTVKYMQCLAAGIPCLMHTWVVESCRENTLLKKDNYLLPSGYSIINNSLPSDKSVYRKSANLFKGMRFMLISKNNKLRDLWQPVLRASNAFVVDDLPSSPGTSTRKATHSVDVIVSDPSCPAAVVRKAKQFKIPIVSSEYLAQCLINGKKLSYTAHENFKYTHIFK